MRQCARRAPAVPRRDRQLSAPGASASAPPIPRSMRALAIRARHPLGRLRDSTAWAAHKFGDASRSRETPARTATEAPRSRRLRQAPPFVRMPHRKTANPHDGHKPGYSYRSRSRAAILVSEVTDFRPRRPAHLHLQPLPLKLAERSLNAALPGLLAATT